MRVVFFGTPDSAVPTLEALFDAGHEIPLVVTQPDRPVGRGRRPRRTSIKRAAQQRDLELIQPAKIRTESFAE